ncbi:MAG: hypothetical protein JWM77_2212 [Rhodospirillales bacterium]|nr:hypothetical protein [Rhodospirillales bacterium]
MTSALDASGAGLRAWPLKLAALFAVSACITVPYFAGWAGALRYHDQDERVRVAVLALLFLVQLAGTAWLVRSRIEAALPVGRTAWICLALYTALSVLVGAAILQGFPNSADEWIFVFQADTYARGRLYNPLPPEPDTGLFYLIHIFMRDGKWIGQYPPGWPAVLVPFRMLHIPAWLANVMMGTALLAATARMALRLLPPTEAALATCAVALTPFIVFNNGSFYSHQMPALLGVLFALVSLNFLRAPSWPAALAGGVCLGLIGITRYMDVLALATPFGVLLLWKARRQPKMLLPALGFALGALPFLVLLLAYDKAVTGDALRAVSRWGYPDDPVYRLGFNAKNTPPEALVRLLRRQAELMEWTAPALLLLWGVAFVVRVVTRRATWLDWIYPSFLGWYALSPVQGGERYGPRYYLPAYPFMVLTIATAIGVAPRLGRWLRAGLATCLPVALALGIGWAIFTQRMVHERRAMEIAIDEARLANVVVIVPGSIGTVRPMEWWDLARNDPDMSNSVLFAADYVDTEAGTEQRLAELFPDRAIWRYRWDRPSRQGTLELVREPSSPKKRSEAR